MLHDDFALIGRKNFFTVFSLSFTTQKAYSVINLSNRIQSIIRKIEY